MLISISRFVWCMLILGLEQDAASLCQRLSTEGLVPVPHLAARAICNKQELGTWLATMRDSGVQRVLLLAGDNDTPAGDFSSSLDVLLTGQAKHVRTISLFSLLLAVESNTHSRACTHAHVRRTPLAISPSPFYLSLCRAVGRTWNIELGYSS